jgi:hypothetical protein
MLVPKTWDDPELQRAERYVNSTNWAASLTNRTVARNCRRSRAARRRSPDSASRGAVGSSGGHALRKESKPLAIAARVDAVSPPASSRI